MNRLVICQHVRYKKHLGRQKFDGLHIVYVMNLVSDTEYFRNAVTVNRDRSACIKLREV